MKHSPEVYIKKIYPDNWDRYSERDKQKKEQEFNIASFVLNDSSVKIQFEGKEPLCVQFLEGPDFLVYSENNPSDKIGLEITKCYINDKHNSPAINSDLEKICKEVIQDIQHTENTNLSHINYIDVKFAHEVMVGYQYDKKILKSELKKMLLDNKTSVGKYVKEAKAGYSYAYIENNLKITIFSEMMYIVPRISDIELDPVLNNIEIKEKKLGIYKQKDHDSVNNWWLCIEIPKDAYLNPSLYKLPSGFKSNYNKIYVSTLSFWGHGTHLIFSK